MSEDISQDVSIRGEGNIVVGKGDVIINPLSPAETRLRHDLGILLKNVKTTWIKGVLEKSVHEAALLELGMEIRDEAVDNPWHVVIEGPGQSREVLPRGRKIKDIFDEANRLLLILGEPGSGKTTTLLQLARDLIAEVDQAITQPVPVILNLSTWTNKQQPLDEWLIAELNSKYRLPKKDGKRWLRERRILPLLDGLDEVKAENRAACVEKINQLVSDYGLQGMVVCSRIKDYVYLNIRLAFYRAIYIQPLTPEQVDQYLESAGELLAGLRAALQSDEALQHLAQSPLILNVMSLAYQDISAEALSSPGLNTDEVRRKYLFETYIARMFSRKASARPYDDERTKQRLSWLARNMQKHNQDVFLVEGLQPSWLQPRRWQWVYALASRLSGVLILGLIFELVGVLSGLPYGRVSVVVKFLVLSIGLPVGFIDVLRFESLSKHKGMGESHKFWWSIANVIVLFLLFGLLLVILTYTLNYQLGDGLFLGLIFGLPFGLIFGLRGSRQNLEKDIQTVEALQWSWRNALVGGMVGALLGGLIATLMGGVISGWVGLLDGSLWVEWTLAGGGLGGPLGAIFKGLSREIIEAKSVPNQGIRLSINNAIFGGLIVGLTIVGLDFVLKDVQSHDALMGGLIIAGFAGLIGALWYGGLDVIQHYILRFILAIQGHTPANYSRFLDYAVDRIFLHKVGGGYRFIHRLLLEHFADMDDSTKKV